MIKIFNYGQVADEEIFARDNIAANVEGVVAEIIATVIKNGDAALFEAAKEAMGEGSYLIPLVTNFIPELKKNKKLQSALIK